MGHLCVIREALTYLASSDVPLGSFVITVVFEEESAHTRMSSKQRQMVIFLAEGTSTSSVLSSVLVADDPDVTVTFCTNADPQKY